MKRIDGVGDLLSRCGLTSDAICTDFRLQRADEVLLQNALYLFSQMYSLDAPMSDFVVP
jgi:hypothetical protein